MRTIALAGLALFCLPFAGYAQQVSYSQYGTPEGLPSNEVTEVVRDSSGFAWIATDRRLVRYDGQRFTTYRHLPEDRAVTGLEPRAEGGIWFATEGGVFAAVPVGDTVAVRAATNAVFPDTSAEVTGLFREARGVFWVSRADGTVEQIRDDGQRRSYTLQADRVAGKSRPSETVLFAEDRESRLWAVTPAGRLYRYARAQERFVAVGDLGLDEPLALHVRHDTLWAVGDGLVRTHVTADGDIDNTRRFSAGGRLLTDVAFGRGRLFLGSADEGLFRGRVGAEGLALRPVYGGNDPHRTVVLPFQNVHDLYVDRDATIWVGSEQGVGLLQIPFFRVAPDLPKYTAYALHPGPNGMSLALGEAFRVEVGSTQGPTVRPVSVPIEPSIASIASADDTLWLGTADGRLLTVASGQTTRVQDLSERGGSIFYVYDDRRGHVWACQAPEGTPLKGVARLSPGGTWTFYDGDDGLAHRVLSLREGPDGTLYTAGIGAETYLHRYVPGQDRFVNLSRSLPFDPGTTFEAHDLAVGPDGTIWLATTAGLLRHDETQTHRVDLGEYTADEVRSVETMANGDVWLATATHGLLHYREGTTVRVGRDRGLIATQMMYRTLRADGRGRLWAGTTLEGVVYSRDRVPVPDSTPTPRLFAAWGDGQALGTQGPLSLEARDPLTLRYGALAFPVNGEVQYQYRVRGTRDTSWSDASADPTLRLHQVSARMEAVEIRARSGTGRYWSNVLRVPVDVRPVWYRRWWAYLLFALGTAGIVGVLVRLYLDRRAAQAALRDREIRLRGIANSIPGVVFQAVVSPDDTYDVSFVSKHAETLLGLSADPEAFYTRFTEHIPPSHRDAFRSSLREAFRAGARTLAARGAVRNAVRRDALAVGRLHAGAPRG